MAKDMLARRIEYLIEPPRELSKNYQRDYWKRVCLAILILAENGISTIPDLLYSLSNELGLKISSYPLKRLVYKTLPDDGLATKSTLLLDIAVKLSLIQLTPYGKDLARSLGVEPVESDYERILRLHDGENQPKHTAQVLFAAYQARLRGYKVKVMPFEPDDGRPWHQPDLKITDDAHVYSVEVESHSRDKPSKWVGKREANIILPNPKVRELMVARIKKLGVPGRATDLKTLALMAKQGELRYFWLERW